MSDRIRRTAASTPSLSDGNLRRRIFVETAIRSASRVPLPWCDILALSVSLAFFGAFFAGLLWHLLLFTFR